MQSCSFGNFNFCIGFSQVQIGSSIIHVLYFLWISYITNSSYRICQNTGSLEFIHSFTNIAVKFGYFLGYFLSEREIWDDRYTKRPKLLWQLLPIFPTIFFFFIVTYSVELLWGAQWCMFIHSEARVNRQHKEQKQEGLLHCTVFVWRLHHITLPAPLKLIKTYHYSFESPLI